MPKKLTFPEFIKAGHRNVSVCRELLGSLKGCPARSRAHILHKIFYLSGYVIEFSYKYILFSSLKVKETQNLYEYDDVSFRTKWQQHNFDKLRLLLDTKRVTISTDVPYIGFKIESKEMNDLIQAWDVQIRYSLELSHQPVRLTQPLMEEFVNLTEQILQKVTSRY